MTKQSTDHGIQQEHEHRARHPRRGTTGDKHRLARISLGRVLGGKGLTAVAGPDVGKAFSL